jgi:hypothetical protein
MGGYIMENAVDSLKIAFGVLIFTVALSISISTFSNARRAIDGITTIKDKTQEYVYLEPSTTSNRDVGIETIIPALYKAYSENYRVEFWVKDSAGTEKKLILYSRRNVEAREKNWEEVNYIDLIDENFGSESLAIDHLNALLTNGHTKFYINASKAYGVKDISAYKRYNSTNTILLYDEEIGSKSGDIAIGSEGLYEFLKDKKFEERLGEYYQEDKSEGKVSDTLEINKTKKRIITYVWKNY